MLIFDMICWTLYLLDRRFVLENLVEVEGIMAALKEITKCDQRRVTPDARCLQFQFPVVTIQPMLPIPSFPHLRNCIPFAVAVHGKIWAVVRFQSWLSIAIKNISLLMNPRLQLSSLTQY